LTVDPPSEHGPFRCNFRTDPNSRFHLEAEAVHLLETHGWRDDLEIKQGRMVHLGYGKYWRSDEIVGLCPIEESRGPGRRTEVFVSTREDPLVVSRSERSILSDMASLPDEEFQAEEARSLLSELMEDLSDVNSVLRRMLLNEVRVDLDVWEHRIKALLHRGPARDEDGDQEDLFSARG